MLNSNGIRKTTATNMTQILANVDIQASFGCTVPQSLGVTVGDKKIAKAGTPVQMNFKNLQEDVKDGKTNAMNAVLLHDVDVTTGSNNGTALYLGTVNLNRVETDVATAIDTAVAVEGATQRIIFVKA